MMRLFYITFIVLICSVKVFAQDAGIRVIARAAGDSIVLRWSPTTPASWKYLNKYGYRIERYTIVRDSAVLENKTLKNIQPQPILPSRQPEWEKFIDRDDFVAIAAQAIYGETFEISNNASTSASDVISLSQEQESRYSYAIFAAENSMAAANLSALRFVDRDVKRNEKYLYRVYSMVPENIAKIEMGYTYVGLKDYQPLPKITEPLLQFGDKYVMVSWRVASFKDVYTGYYIERSENGKDFSRINKIPYVSLSSETKDENMMLQIDSLKNNDQPYYYRVVGLTSFAETGPPSNVAHGQGVDKLDVTVNKLKASVNASDAVELVWEFPAEKETLINKFEVERSIRANDGFKIISGSLPVNQRKYTDQKASSTNYYRVVAVGKNGKRKVSFAVLIQKEDSIPPVQPVNVIAKIDTAGIVTVQWNKNEEQDLLGYRVYRSNFANSEFSQMTVSPISETIFTDTLNIKTLTKKVYYKVAAIDNRFNTSPFSITINLTKPDIIPPTPPLFKKINATEQGIEIRWIGSSSEDVSSHKLYRKTGNTKDWQLIKVLDLVDSIAYIDKDVVPAQKYEYKITAIDDAGLESLSVALVSIKAFNDGQRSQIKKIKIQVDREQKVIKIDWSYQENGISKFQIYRASVGEPISLYKIVQPGDHIFLDSNVSLSTTYVYRIKALFADGTESKFSEEIKVTF
jgi:fibronectin type 3 domain-containing protein